MKKQFKGNFVYTQEPETDVFSGLLGGKEFERSRGERWNEEKVGILYLAQTPRTRTEKQAATKEQRSRMIQMP